MASGTWHGWRVAIGRLSVVLLLAPAALAATVEGPLERVEFGQGDTIRGVAARYLKDPDLWPQILELSGVASPAELKPGAMLLIPVQQVAAADEALAFSLVAIQKATAEGARIFAPDEIGSAIENRDIAVERRGEGEWVEVVTYAETATEYADRAYEISLDQRDRAAEAVVSDAQGSVEGKAPDQARWSARRQRDVLVEYEEVRTLSASTAQVTFRDLSRLRLNPNSNAIIQRMRSDPLTGGEVTKVSLVNGDFYALLNQLGDRTAFEVAVPGIQTETRSSDFWIKHDEGESRFANYDAPALEITRGAETISLGANEGAVVPEAGAPERTRVLARTELAEPFDGATVYDAAVTLSWAPSEGADAYWLEVAADAGFNEMQASEWGVRGTSHAVEGLAPGDHFWRVSSLDRLGLPGVRSLSRRFRLIDDETPPYVALTAPTEGAIVSETEVAVTGESEPGATLAVNGRRVPVADNGSFATTVAVTAGDNSVTVAAVDPAGNRTERARSFVHRPPENVAIALAPDSPRDADGTLLTATPEADVAGVSTAAAGAGLNVRAADDSVAVRTVVGEGGTFRFTVPAGAEATGYRIEIVGPEERVEGSVELAVRQDATAPEIRLDAPPPSATANAWLDLGGTAEGAASLTVNGVPEPLDAGRFAAVATLAPGTNAIELVATDAVGNVAVQRLEVVHDVDPPEILTAAARRPQGDAGPIEILVEARDPAGIRQAAPFVLTVGGAERRGFLRCDAAAGTCRETLPAEPGALALVEVTVEDYAGNRAVRNQ
jgi:uncharacterized protein YfaP (DUF2135 family)